MCGRFVITSPPAALRQIFGYLEQPNFPPRHNIAPTQPIPVVMVENGVRHFRLMRWGLLPAWVKVACVDINPATQAVARSHLGMDPRLTILTEDARATVQREPPNSLDLVFADGGVGKHVLLDEMLALLRPGGIYICDDTKPHPMWPPEHAAKIRPVVVEAAERSAGLA